MNFVEDITRLIREINTCSSRPRGNLECFQRFQSHLAS
jgi:hypothetical protein